LEVIDYLDEVVGQDTAKRFIRTAIKKENLYNFLLTGPKGVGKRLFGFKLSEMLNCPPQSTNFMLIGPIPSKIKDKEDKIHEYTKTYLPDNPVVEFEDRTAILIEQIRDTIKRLVHMPGIGSKRVVLIIEADRMTAEAANCFLKTLEEPPLDTFFILTSSRPNSLLPTILSRCQHIRFTHLNNEQIKKIIFDGQDDYMLGSPGEIMIFQENELLDSVCDIFKRCPLSAEIAAQIAREYERKKIIDILYPLLLMYRLLFYKKIKIALDTSLEPILNKKVKTLSLEQIAKTIELLNTSIYSLERNPSRLLLLFNILMKLP
jgi:replication-associated recombination protein RarA